MPQPGTSLQGFDATIALFKKYQGKAEQQADVIMSEFADRILKKSLEYCPMDTGALRASARVIKGNQPTEYTIVYGSGAGGGFRDSYYAVYVHEIPKANYTTPGTGWKYLERAVDEIVPEIIAEFPKKFAGTSYGAAERTGEFLENPYFSFASSSGE